MFTLGGGGRLTLNLWSDFATATFLYSLLKMFTLGGGGLIDTQLLKWLCNCNFSVLTSGNVHLRWGGGLIDTQLLKWLCKCNFSVLTSGNVHLGGGVDRHSTFEVTLQLQLFCTHLWKCSPWGGRSTLNFWSDFANATFLYSPLEMFTLGGGSIDTQLLKWLCKCNFSVLTSGNVHLRWGGGQSTLNFWSDFANATFLYSPLEMFTLGGGVDRHSTFEVTLQLQLFCIHLWKCSP